MSNRIVAAQEIGAASPALVWRWTSQRLSANDSASALHDELLELVEPPFLEAAMEQHAGQCASAARALGLHRTTLKKKLDQYGLVGDDE